MAKTLHFQCKGHESVPSGDPSRHETWSKREIVAANNYLMLVDSVIIQFSSVAQSCPTLCDPMNCSTPGIPVHHHLPDFTQTHVHRIRDAIQPSDPWLSPSPPAPNPSQHQSLLQ